MQQQATYKVFIDESGDTGLSQHSSPYFILAAVVASSETEAALAHDIAAFRQIVKFSPRSEFKFSQTHKQIIRDLLKRVSRHDFNIYLLLYHKHDTRLSPRDLLLALISGIEEPFLEVQVDGGFGKKYQRETRSYLRKQLPDGKLRKFRYINSGNSDLIQLADLIAGSFARSLSSKSDSQAYYKIIKSKVVKVIER